VSVGISRDREIAKVAGIDFQSIFSVCLNLALLAGAALYAGLILMRYLTDGQRPRPVVDPRDPAQSAERLAVWLGVKALALAVRMLTPIFEMLSEASAEVGEWFLSNRRHETP